MNRHARENVLVLLKLTLNFFLKHPVIAFYDTTYSIKGDIHLYPLTTDHT